MNTTSGLCLPSTRTPSLQDAQIRRSGCLQELGSLSNNSKQARALFEHSAEYQRDIHQERTLHLQQTMESFDCGHCQDKRWASSMAMKVSSTLWHRALVVKSSALEKTGRFASGRVWNVF